MLQKKTGGGHALSLERTANMDKTMGDMKDNMGKLEGNIQKKSRKTSTSLVPRSMKRNLLYSSETKRSELLKRSGMVKQSSLERYHLGSNFSTFYKQRIPSFFRFSSRQIMILYL